jgi:type II secretory pathway predicted ATPase ExeA
MVVSGEVGTGKTTLLRSAMNHFNFQINSVYIFNPFLTVSEFFLQLSDELQIPRTTAKPEMLTMLYRLLLARYSKGQRTVLIIDEAHGLSPELLEEIRLLLNFEMRSRKLLQIILCGQPELRETLNEPSLRQFKQRISLHCQIKPLSLFELEKYIRFRLKIAGAPRLNLFTDDAIELIGETARGIPRVVNNICDNALHAGARAREEEISRPIVEEVVEMLSL